MSDPAEKLTAFLISLGGHGTAVHDAHICLLVNVYGHDPGSLHSLSYVLSLILIYLTAKGVVENFHDAPRHRNILVMHKI